MNTHKKTSLTPKGLVHLVTEIARIGLMPAAEAASISVRTTHKWQRRFAAEDPASSLDRSPQHSRAYAHRHVNSALRADKQLPRMHHDSLHRPDSATSLLPPLPALA